MTVREELRIIEIDGVQHKLCSHCRERKPQDAYSPSNWHEGSSQCRTCTNGYAKRHAAEMKKRKTALVVRNKPKMPLPAVDIQTLLGMGDSDPRMRVLMDVLKQRNDFDKFVVDSLLDRKRK